MAEPYRPDLYDLQLAVRSWPSVELSAIERPLRTQEGGHILDYRDKYVAGEGMAGAQRELPARMPEEVAAELRSAASAVVHLAGVRGMARIDFLSDGRDLFVNEVNTIPGSLARYLWVDPAVAVLRPARRPPRRSRAPTDARLFGGRRRRIGAALGRLHRRQVGLKRWPATGSSSIPASDCWSTCTLIGPSSPGPC